MQNSFLRLAAATAACAPVLVAAQAAQRAEPAALPYPSAFADYKPYRDIAPGDWRRLNDVVGTAALKPAVPPPAASGAAGPARPGMPMAAPAPALQGAQGGHGAHGSPRGGRP